jgi:hypothetical protein
LQGAASLKLMSGISRDVNRKLQLDGHAEELQCLAKMFNSPGTHGGLCVWSSEHGTYYLHAPELEKLTDVRTVFKRGKVLVGRLNGLGVLKFGAFRPVWAAAVSQAAPATHFSVGSINPPNDALLAYLDYTPNRPPVMNATVGPMVAALPLVEAWADVADRYAPHVDDALLLLSLAIRAEDWRMLYVVYEIVEDLVGKRKVGKLRASITQIKSFKRTANSRRALGTQARHGHSRHVPPKRPMTFTQAKALIRELLLAALRYLSAVR